jgi:hypothetical protein
MRGMSVAYKTLRFDLFGIQNFLSLGVFFTLAYAQLFAYALYIYPHSEWLWFLSLKLNRLSDPVFSILDGLTLFRHLPLWVVLWSLCILPFYADRHKSWLGTALLGHIALGLCIVCGSGFIDRLLFPPVSADAGAPVMPQVIHWNVWIVIAAAAIMAILCALNHIVYFRNVMAAARKSQTCRDGAAEMAGPPGANLPASFQISRTRMRDTYPSMA